MKTHLVDPEYFMYDVAEDGPPTAGQHVLALGRGGKTVEVVWTKGSEQCFYAWCRFPKVKKITKERMAEQFPFNEETE